jgi:hypothetical protein
MERMGNFLWFPWLRSWVQTPQQSPDGWFAYWQGAHNGYQRCQPPVHHRRGIVRLGDHHWLVLDALSSRDNHCYRLHWLFPDVPYVWEEGSGHLTLDLLGSRYHVQLAAVADQGTQSLIRADPHSPRGWRATYYNYREPALSLDMTKVADTVCFWTLFGPTKCQVEVEATALHITTECWHASVKLQLSIGEVLMTDAHVSGIVSGTLKVE